MLNRRWRVSLGAKEESTVGSAVELSGNACSRRLFFGGRWLGAVAFRCVVVALRHAGAMGQFWVALCVRCAGAAE